MSYILDALKKSELERNRKAAPSLIGTAPQMPHARTKIAIGVTIALLANALLLGAWWFWPRNAAVAQTTSPESSVSAAPAVIESPPGTDAGSQPAAEAGPQPAQVAEQQPDSVATGKPDSVATPDPTPTT